MKRTLVLVCLFALTALLSTAVGQNQSAKQAPGKPMFTAIRRGHPAQALQAAAAGANVPMWSSSFSYQGTTYPFTMVGADPTITNHGTNVPLVIVPVIFKFGTTTISPSQIACADTRSALYRVTNSPLLKNFPFVSGTTNVGTTQYIDAYQRANFWNSVSTVSP